VYKKGWTIATPAWSTSLLIASIQAKTTIHIIPHPLAGVAYKLCLQRYAPTSGCLTGPERAFLQRVTNLKHQFPLGN